MRLPVSLVLVLSLVALGGLALGAAAAATVASAEGAVTVQTGVEEPRELAAGDSIEEGDVVTLSDGARLSIAFAAGGEMDVTGPARIEAVLLEPYARTIMLHHGIVNRVQPGVRQPDNKPVVIGVDTSFGPFISVQEGEAYAEVDSDDAMDRVVFKVFDGMAKVSDRVTGKIEIVDSEKPVIIERERVSPGPQPVMEPQPTLTGGAKVINLGGHAIYMRPGDGARIEPLSGGGVRITSIVGSGEFLVVIIDGDQTLYLATDDFVEFDENGKIVRLDGISHVYAALDLRGIYDEAVADPSDASFTGTKNP
jgi:hypothetical protein